MPKSGKNGGPNLFQISEYNNHNPYNNYNNNHNNNNDEPNKQNEEGDTIAPLKGGGAPGLPKAKSIVRAGGLKRSASSKNILLRHLDNRPNKNQL